MGSAHRLGAPYQALRAKDGYFTVGAGSDKLFSSFCKVLGRENLLKDERFSKRAGRMANRPALIAEIETVTKTKPRAEWLERLEEAGVPAGPINDYAEALADRHTLARGMVVDLIHPGAGAIKALGVPVKLSDTPGAVERAAPLLGEHTAEILKELCYSESEERALRAKGVIQ
jgi:formyl-CoA transferase